MSLTSFILLIILFVFLKLSISKINLWKNNNRENKKIQETIEETAIIPNDNSQNSTNSYKVDFTSLKQANSDTIAWLEVPGTDINYPVVHTDNNSYYLTHNFNKEYNEAGWIFADESNKFDGTDRNIVIYGHNIKK